MLLQVLHVLDHSLPVHSGYTFRTSAILEHQRARGWSTYQVTSAKHPLDGAPEEEVEGLRFFRSPRPGGFGARLPVLNQWAIVRTLEARLEQLIVQLEPDILHAHSPALNGLAALRAGRRHGIPVVYEVRAFWEDAAVDHGTAYEWGLRYRLTRALETYVLRNVSAVTTICEGLRQDIVNRGVPGERITVIPNAVDLKQFNTGAGPDAGLMKRLGLEAGKVLGFIGSFYAYEGLADLLRALAIVRQRDSAVRLLLVGGGPQQRHLCELTETLGLKDAVIFTGRVPHRDVQRYYDLIDLFIYPRRSMRLTELVTPLKPLEAMARGRLVIASDVGGHRELIRDQSTGGLFQPGNPESLAESVTEFLGNTRRWEARREAARRFVETERNWPASVARYEKVYTPLVARCAKT